MKIQRFEKIIKNAFKILFSALKISFEFFLNVTIYDMKTDKKKLKETLLREKEIKMRQQ